MNTLILFGLMAALAGGAHADISDSGNLNLNGQAVIGGTVTVSGNAFSVGGSTFAVTASSVGIRTASPAAALDVNGSAQFGSGAAKSTFTAAGLLKLTASGVQWADGSTSTTAAAIPAGVALLSATQIFSGANTYLGQSYFTGNVGIGTTSPGKALEVDGAGSASGSGTLELFRLRNTSGTANLAAIGFVGQGNDGNPAALIEAGTEASTAGNGAGSFQVLAADPTGAKSQMLYMTNDYNDPGGQRIVLSTSRGGKVFSAFNNGSDSGYIASYGIVTSSTPIPTISCNAGTGVMQANATANHGTFTAGTGAANCTVTFINYFAHTPDCICADQTSIQALKAINNANSVQCAAAATMSGDTITYICMGAP